MVKIKCIENLLQSLQDCLASTSQENQTSCPALNLKQPSVSATGKPMIPANVTIRSLKLSPSHRVNCMQMYSFWRLHVLTVKKQASLG